MSEESTFAAMRELYSREFIFSCESSARAPKREICSGVLREVFPFPPQIYIPKSLSSPRIASLSAAVRIVVSPDAFQSKASTVPSA